MRICNIAALLVPHLKLGCIAHALSVVGSENKQPTWIRMLALGVYCTSIWGLGSEY